MGGAAGHEIGLGQGIQAMGESGEFYNLSDVTGSENFIARGRRPPQPAHQFSSITHGHAFFVCAHGATHAP